MSVTFSATRRVCRRASRVPLAVWLLLAMPTVPNLEALEIEGRLVDSRGQGLAGRTVHLEPAVCPGGGVRMGDGAQVEAHSNQTDRRGQYRFEGVDQGLWILRTAPERASGAELGRRLTPLLHDVRLPPIEIPDDGRRLRLVDVEGRPLTGQGFEQGRTDDFGGAFWRAVSDRQGYVQASWPEQVGDSAVPGWQIVDVEPGLLRLRRRLDSELAPVAAGRRVEIAVRANDGSPLQGAVVWSAGAECDSWSVSGEDGRAELLIEHQAGRSIRAQASGFSVGEIQIRRGFTEVIELTPRPAVVTGQVMDQDGSLLEDALVSWRPGHRSAVSDGNGLFRLRDLPRTPSVPVTVEKAGFLPLEVTARPSVSASAGGEEHRQLVLLRPWALAGRALSPAQQPLQECLVTLSSEPSLSAECDENGRYRLSGVPAGRHLLYFESLGRVKLVEIELDAAAPNPLHLRDVMVGEGGVVVGWALDAATGAPIADLEIFADLASEVDGAPERDVDLQPDLPMAARTDAAGYFRMPGLKPLESMHLEFWHDAFQPQRREVSVGQGLVEEVIVRLEAGAYAELVLRDQASGRPVVGAKVSQLARGELATFLTGSRPFAISDLEGRVRLRVQPKSELSVRAIHADYAWEEKSFEIDSAGVSRFEMPMLRASHIAGKVFDTSGRLVTRGHVVAELEEGDSLPFWRDSLGHAGSFDIAGIRPGLGKLRIFGFDQELIEEVPMVFESGFREVEVLLGSGAVR